MNSKDRNKGVGRAGSSVVCRLLLNIGQMNLRDMEKRGATHVVGLYNVVYLYNPSVAQFAFQKNSTSKTT